MKHAKYILVLLLVNFTFLVKAQTVTEQIKVDGVCSSCQKKIEKAAKDAGASFASWNKNTKWLTVKYNPTSASKEKLEHSIASVGYDTQDVKASDKAYDDLDDCCKYKRSAGKKE